MRIGAFLSGFLLCLLVIGILFSVSSFLVTDGLAWSNGGFSSDPANPNYGTHDWIAQHALDWLPAVEKQYILGYLTWYLDGTELPDKVDTTNHHIYYDSSGFLFDDAAAVRASTEYNYTLAYLKGHFNIEAARNAGIMTHYIVDMAVFGHVMGASTSWGAETHHSDFEDYVDARTSAYIAEFNSFLLFDGNLDAISAYEAAKKLAYDTTFDLDGSLTCVWMDHNYDWGNPAFRNRAGESLNLAVNYLADVLHTLYLEANMPDEYYLSVLHYVQKTGYYCGPAALEMVFDYYGPDVPQAEIADVARTTPEGTPTPDMIRAAHFSNLSTSVGNEMPGSIQGYTARKLGYAALEYSGMTIDQLKFTIALGYPVIVVTTWHYRVAVGYSEAYITFQDSWWGRMYNMTYSAFDSDWDYSGHWALLVAPWKVQLAVSSETPVGRAFNVAATVTYPSPPPFSSTAYPASVSHATLILPFGISLAAGQTAEKIINDGNLTPGETVSLNWTILADAWGNYSLGVEAEGKVTGSPLSYPMPYSYTDRIGGYNQTSINAIWDDTMPPATTHNYDGSWHTADFEIALAATDDASGVADTYYKVNDGPTSSVLVDGQPIIATEAADNKLEYWSVDNVGNEESHHVLTGIKLDKTAPTGSIVINSDALYAVLENVQLLVEADDATSGVSSVRYSNDGVWDTESWEALLPTKVFLLTTGDGTKTVYCQVKDNAGLISSTYSDTIVLDTALPAVSITSPISGYEVKSFTLTVTWTGADETSGISHYEIHLDNEPSSDVGTDLAFTLTGIADGTHTVTVTAVDKAGHGTSDTVAFVVNTSPLGGPGYMEEGGIAAALLIIALGIIGYVMRRRGKR